MFKDSSNHITANILDARVLEIFIDKSQSKPKVTVSCRVMAVHVNWSFFLGYITNGKRYDKILENSRHTIDT